MEEPLQYDTFKNFYNREHQLSMGLSYDQAKSYYRSGGFLGILNNDRTVEPLYNSLDQPIELVAEQEHTGNGGNPDEKERGDVGPAEVTGKLNLYGSYISNTLNMMKELLFLHQSEQILHLSNLLIILKLIYIPELHL